MRNQSGEHAQPPAIDMLADFPLPAWLEYHARRLVRIGGYLERFARPLGRAAAVSPEEIQEWSRLPSDDAGARLAEALIGRAPSLEDWLGRRRRLGIVHSLVLHEDPGDLGIAPADLSTIATQVAAHSDELTLYAGVSPGAGAAAKLEQADALGLRGVMLSPFMARLPASDPAWLPIFEFCNDRGWVAWVHSSAHFWPDSPPDVGHPRHLAVVAARYPRLLLIAGHSGYPWVGELVSAMRKSPGILADLSTFRPAQLLEPAWQPLYEAGQADLADRVLFAGGSIGLDVGRLLEELDRLPISPRVLHAWRYANAANTLGLPAAAA